MEVYKVEAEAGEMKTVMEIFQVDLRSNTKMTFGTAIVLPGQRLPAEGTTSHTADEYSYIMKGDIYTSSGGIEQIVQEKSATLIPKGEEHWCRNDGSEAVEILWVFVE